MERDSRRLPKMFFFVICVATRVRIPAAWRLMFIGAAICCLLSYDVKKPDMCESDSPVEGTVQI